MFSLYKSLLNSQSLKKSLVFNSKVEMSSETLKDHCEIVRNEVEVKTESLIQKIEKNKESLLKQIDNYETDCEMKIKNEKHRIEIEYLNFINKYNNYLPVKKKPIERPLITA
jgi:hypothetical protein